MNELEIKKIELLEKINEEFNKLIKEGMHISTARRKTIENLGLQNKVRNLTFVDNNLYNLPKNYIYFGSRVGYDREYFIKVD